MFKLIDGAVTTFDEQSQLVKLLDPQGQLELKILSSEYGYELFRILSGTMEPLSISDRLSYESFIELKRVFNLLHQLGLVDSGKDSLASMRPSSLLFAGEFFNLQLETFDRARSKL